MKYVIYNLLLESASAIYNPLFSKHGHYFFGSNERTYICRWSELILKLHSGRRDTPTSSSLRKIYLK